MNYHQYYPVDIVNGPGTRCTLFVSGCVHECPGCYNKSTWRVNSGMPFTAEMADRIIADLNDTRIKRQGLSLSGGDPLHPQNVADILKLVHDVQPLPLIIQRQGAGIIATRPDIFLVTQPAVGQHREVGNAVMQAVGDI